MKARAGLDGTVAQPFASVTLENVFDACFAGGWNTRLVGGAEEPFYRPATAAGDANTLHYRHDYFASALHEVAHWCIAGEQRRQQFDFGYWYAPEGRCANQQRAFEVVETKPQALEWFFSHACGYRFQVSADNLDMTAEGVSSVTAFQHCILEQALYWQIAGLPERADIYYRALCEEFGTAVPTGQLRFTSAQFC